MVDIHYHKKMKKKEDEVVALFGIKPADQTDCGIASEHLVMMMAQTGPPLVHDIFNILHIEC